MHGHVIKTDGLAFRVSADEVIRSSMPESISVPVIATLPHTNQ